MRKVAIALLITIGLVHSPVLFAKELSWNTKTAVVFIANFDKKQNFVGWGSGFFVDEGTVITNKHVIQGGHQYRVFATNDEGGVDLQCFRDITKSDVKINLEDDVAYMRVYLNCKHGVMHFADSDPAIGDALHVIGYPNQGEAEQTLKLSSNPGSVTDTTDGQWLRTDARIHFGNSGGPVVSKDGVIGVAVAFQLIQGGGYYSGLFVPVSIIVEGLTYANNSKFGYTPNKYKDPVYIYTEGEEEDDTTPVPPPVIVTVDDVEETEEPEETYDPFNPTARLGRKASNGDCRKSLGQGGEATGNGRCRCKASYHQNAEGTMCLPGGLNWKQPKYRPRRSSRVVTIDQSAPAPTLTAPKKKTGMEDRVCSRVVKRFANNDRMWKRVNTRVEKRFGFVCER